MNRFNIKEKWSGFFTYEGYDSHIEVPFYIHIDIREDSFNGISSNSEIENLFTESVKVQGFRNEDLVSFIVKYPYLYYLNENDEIVVDKNLAHPDIQFLGYLNDNKDKIKGNWEMTVNREKELDDNILEILGGGFELNKGI